VDTTVAISAVALGGATLAGLLGSPHCVGMCGGFAAAAAHRSGGALAWHVGRMATYAALGALAGLGGGSLPGPAWLPGAIAGVLLVWFSGRLAGVVPEVHLAGAFGRLGGGGLSARLAAHGGGGPLGGVVLGAASGLLPCGLVYAALALPVATGHPGWGALTMVAFGLGTVPALSVAATALRRLAAASPWTRRGVAVAVLAAGLWSLGARKALTAEAGEPPACHQVDDGPAPSGDGPESR
jgi:sulfite exporter TauE/SafE